MSGPLVLSLFPGIGLLDMAFEQEGFVVVRGPDCLWGGDIRSFHPPTGRFDGVIGGPPCQTFSTLANLVRAKGLEPKFGNLIPEFERVVSEAQPGWFLMENVPAAPVPHVDGYTVDSFELDNVWLGEEQRRRRRFSFGVFGEIAPKLMRWIQQAPLELPRTCKAVTQANVTNTPEAKGRVQRPTVHGGHDDTPGVRAQRPAVCGRGSEVSVKLGGSGKVKATYQSPTVTGSDGGESVRMTRYRFAEACRLQGLPEDFLADAPFTAAAKLKAVANGVPLPMGRAVARAVKRALGL